MITTAMLLGAGRGERMRPLTDTCPKPLLPVKGRPLVGWAMQAMHRSGIQQCVLNTAWLGAHIEAEFGTQAHGLQLRYSHEGQDFGHALETAGGIARALPMLGDTFWLAAGDVFAPTFVFDQDVAQQFVQSQALAHLWLVANPTHNPHGDFALGNNALLSYGASAQGEMLTYATIGLFKAALFTAPWCNIAHANPRGDSLPLAPLLRLAMDQGLVTGQRFQGEWVDVGTPQRLDQLNQTA